MSFKKISSTKSYRYFFFFTLFSNSGIWMQRVVQDWITLDLTDSARALGITTSLQFLPAFLFSLYGGRIADRCNKPKILLTCNTLYAVLAVLSGFLIQRNLFTFKLLLVFVAAFGLVSAVDGPVRMSYITDLLGNDKVSKGVGLNSVNINLGRLVGPLLAGVIGSQFGIYAVQYLVGIFFGITALVVWFLRPSDYKNYIDFGFANDSSIKEGVKHLRQNRQVMLVTTYVFVLAFFAMHFPTTIMLMARFEYQLEIQEFTFVYSSIALGFVFGGAVLSTRRRFTELTDIRNTTLGFSILLFVGSLASNAIIFSVFLILIGIASTMLIGSLNSFIQERSPEEFRGRFLGAYLAAFTCGTTLGVILVGIEVDLFGARFPLRIAALAVPVFGFLLLRFGSRGQINKVIHPGLG